MLHSGNNHPSMTAAATSAVITVKTAGQRAGLSQATNLTFKFLWFVQG
jgi:hypothetical protein